jgi:iron complex outermembrane receptor protein
MSWFVRSCRAWWCLLPLFALSYPVHAAPDIEVASAGQMDSIETREVVVSSTRLPDAPVDARTLPAKVTVITAEEIRKSGAKSVQEAIQWATGIVMYDGVGNAFQQTIDLRGFNGQPVPNTTVFVDGQRMNEPDFNTVNFDLIPYETIDRIEIIPGAAAIYGKNAMGGVINIITKRGTDKHQATGETLFGSFHRERYTLNASGPIGKFDYYTNFSRETESGFRDESAGRISRFFGKLGYRPTERTDITLSYTYVKDRLQQAGTLPLSQAAIDPKRNFTPGDFFDSETSVVRLNARHEFPLGFSVNANGFYRRLGQEQFTVFQSGRGTNNLMTESRGGVFQLNHNGQVFGHSNALVVGSEYTRNDFGNRSLALFSFGPSSSLRSTDETVLGLYAQDTLNLTSQLILTSGVRYDRNDLDFVDNLDTINNGSKVFHRTTPRAGLTYLVTPSASLYFSYGQGFRVPTYNELFGSGLGPFGQGNPNLRPMRSHSYEVGAKVNIQSWGEASVALFRADVRDEIYLVCGDPSTCNFGSPANQNIPESRRQGIETTFKTKFNQYFDGMVNYTYTQATFQNDLVLNPYFVGFNPFLENVKKGDSIPLVPKNRLSVTGNYHPASGWTISLTGLYVSTQFHQGDEENAQPRIPGYFTLNSRIAYEQPVPGGHLSGFVMLNNMLDQRYYTSGIMAPNTLTGGGAVERFVMPAPGIAIYGGLSYRFEGL